MREIELFLKEVPFFSDLSASDLEMIAPLLIERKYKKGAVIFMEEDLGDELYIIKTGLVKIYRFDGVREIILALFRDGDYFGEMALMQKGQVRSATAETLEASSVLILKRMDFERLLELNPRLAIHLLWISMERLRNANEKIKDLTLLDTRSRIVKMIIQLSEEYGIQESAGILVDLKLTHQQLADMAGAVRETVTKLLLELQDANIISIDKKKILIQDLDLLKEHISFS